MSGLIPVQILKLFLKSDCVTAVVSIMPSGERLTNVCDGELEWFIFFGPHRGTTVRDTILNMHVNF